MAFQRRNSKSDKANSLIEKLALAQGKKLKKKHKLDSAAIVCSSYGAANHCAASGKGEALAILLDRCTWFNPQITIYALHWSKVHE
jgi:hypothetical protein